MIDAKLRVLVVEDNPSDARLLELQLQEVTWASFELEQVGSLADAAARLRQPPLPDAVLLDLNLPDSTRLDTFDRLHAAAPDVPVIVTTGLGDDGLALEAVRRGAQDFLVKGEAGPEMLARSLVHGVERKRAERAAREKEHYFRSILYNMHEDILVIDPDRRITDVNNTVLKTLGLHRDQVVGRRCHEVTHNSAAPCDGHGEVCPLPRVLATGEPALSTHTHVTQDGTLRTVEVLMSPMREEDGTISGVVEAIRDVSERVELEDQLRQAQKMEAIGQLAGGVAHDFNNLLMVIIGSAELVLERLPEGDAQRSHMESIRDAGDRATGLTRQLLAFSRKQVMQPELLDPGALVENLGKMLSRMLGEDMELTLTRGPDPWRVLADPGQLEQVLMNLAVNARDAMPGGGGTLTIDTRNETVAGTSGGAAQGPPDGEYVRLQVTDTGSGIPPSALARVFEPFFTTKALGKGTGLGLSTVFGIVKQSGGFITVTSEAGHGTTFTIYLPRSSVHPVAERCVRPQAQAPAGTGTVLVVEDDANVRRLVCQILAKQGYRVLEACDGEAGVQVAREHRGAIDLVISDVIMPGRTGDAMMKVLWDSRPDTPVLYVSGYPHDRVAQHGVLNANVAFLQKPFTPRALAGKVHEVLGP